MSAASEAQNRMDRAKQLEGREPSMDEVYAAALDLITKIDAVTLLGEGPDRKLTPELVVLAELANGLDLLRQTRGYPPAVWHVVPFNLALKSAISVFPTLWSEVREKVKIGHDPT